MAEGQKRRKIGMGMKRRGSKRVKPQKETKDMSKPSTIEGQSESIIQPVLDAEKGNETPVDLEPKNEEKPASIVAPEDILEFVSAGDELMRAMLESIGDDSQAENSTDEAHRVTGSDTASGTDETMIIHRTDGKVRVGKVEENGDVLDSTTGEFIGKVDVPIKVLEPVNYTPTITRIAGTITEGRRVNLLGVQMDGSKVYAVGVQEAYWPAVEEWAANDGVTVEEWLSSRLYEYISTYGEAPKGR